MSLSFLINQLLSWMSELRVLGVIIITFVAGVVLIDSAAKSQLSPSKTIIVALSALLAAGVFVWLPTLIGSVSNIAPLAPSISGGGSR